MSKIDKFIEGLNTNQIEEQTLLKELDQRIIKITNWISDVNTAIAEANSMSKEIEKDIRAIKEKDETLINGIKTNNERLDRFNLEYKEIIEHFENQLPKIVEINTWMQQQQNQQNNNQQIQNNNNNQIKMLDGSKE